MSQEGDVLIQLRMSKKQAERFVNGLTDAEFRDRLETNPAAVLAEHGIELAPELIPERVRLPDSDELRGLTHSIPGGRGFRTEGGGDGFFHPLLVLIETLARDP